MTFPAVDLYPGPDLFPGTPVLVDVGGYSQPIEIAVNGLVLTATDGFGVDWVAEQLPNWFGSSASTIQMTAKVRGPGGWPSPRQLDSLRITVAGFVEAPTPAALTYAMERLTAAVPLDGAVMSVAQGDTVRSRIVYRQGEPTISIAGDTTAVWSIDVVAADPRKFTTTLSGDTFLPVSTGGLLVPFLVPFTIDSTIVTGTVTLTSPGNYPGPVQLRIDGPVTGPIVTHIGSGRSLVFSSSLTIGAGQWLDIDMEAQTVLANGQSSRNPWINSRGWSSFDPGVNQWAFSAASYDPGSRLAVYATPAWA